MGSSQYLRKLSVSVTHPAGDNVEGVELSQLRCVFNVRRGDYQTPNSCDIRLNNLSSATINQIAATGSLGALTDETGTQTVSAEEMNALQNSVSSRLTIQAGYGGNYGQIFSGGIKQVRLGRVDAKDSYVDITAADGDGAYNFSVMAQSLAAGATPQNEIQAYLAVMARFGIHRGYMPQTSTNGAPRGRVFEGMVRDKLRDFAQSNDLQWSIQDGAFTLIPNTSFVPGPVPVIGPSTGLIGVPEQTQNGIVMRMLLNPSIKIGQCVQLQSNVPVNQYRYGLDIASLAGNALLARSIKMSGDGTYYAMRVEHSGDSRGNDWTTTLTCLAVDASVPLDLAPFAPVTIDAASIPRY